MQLQCKRTLSAEQLHTQDLTPSVVAQSSTVRVPSNVPLRTSATQPKKDVMESASVMMPPMSSTAQVRDISVTHLEKTTQVKIVRLVLPK